MIASGLTADGSDPGMNGVTRYGRLPVGANGKTACEALGAPFGCRATQWNPGRRYRIEEIAKAYKLDLVTRKSGDKQLSPQFPHQSQASERRSHSARAGLRGNARGAGQGRMYLSSRGEWHDIVARGQTITRTARSAAAPYTTPLPVTAWLGGFKCHHGPTAITARSGTFTSSRIT